MNKGRGIVIYTAITGGVDRLREPAQLLEDAQYVCFTDDPALTSEVFDIRPLPFPAADKQLAARQLKLAPHLLFPTHSTSLWIDASRHIIGDLEPLVEEGLDGFDMACFAHPKRDCLYKEAKHCIGEGRADPARLTAQAQRYHAEGMREQGGLMQTSMLLRRHHSPEVKKAMGLWWEELQQGSVRDQVSLPYVLWKTGLRVNALDYRTWHNECFREYPHRHYAGADSRSHRQARARMWLAATSRQLRLYWLYRLSLRLWRAFG